MSPKTEAAIKSMLKLPKYDIHWMVVTQNTPGNQPKVKDHETVVILTVSQIGFLTDGRPYTKGSILVITGGSGVTWGETWYVFKKDNARWHLSKVIPGPVN